ncbi:MAG TPA: radical SAM protein [Thermoanaerobaculia bacterium]|nr:radical SAM protein [Thermoanaerobaculia bacterium]
MTELAPVPVPSRRPEAALPLPCVDPITRLPVVILFPHSRCNCRCLMCDIWRVTKSEEIGTDAVAGWLAEWRRLGVERVMLSGGEPLLHSGAAELGALLRDAGFGVTVLSTGLLLERRAASLVTYCDDLVVSLDGPREVHDRIRNVPRAFDKLARGVAAVRAADPGIAVSGRCTVQRANFRVLRATVEAAREIGLGRISFLAVDVSSEAFNRPGGWEPDRADGVALSPGDLPLLARELRALSEEHAEDFAAGFIAESPEQLDAKLYRYFAALLGRGDFHPVDCNAPWVSAVIETDGTVRPCFFQPALGNVHEAGSLGEILNSPEALAWRSGLDTHRDAVCRKCVCSLNLRDSSTGVEP